MADNPRVTPHDNPASPTRSAPPDWSLVRFEVACARCGADLRGTSDPRCAACGLAFDWAEAVPLEHLTCAKCGYHLYGLTEPRCPECGWVFHWNEALDQYRRRRKPLFEYRWRERPVRSFLASLWNSLRPRKLWRMIDLHDPPAVGVLLLLWAMTLAGHVLTPVALAYPGYLALRLMDYLWPTQYFVAWPPGMPLGWRAPGWEGPWMGIFLGGGLDTTKMVWDLLYLLIWSVAGFAVLLFLRQSMSRCRVRNAHVLRAYAYSLLPTVVVPFLTCLATLVLDARVMLTQSSDLYWARDLLRVAPLALAVWMVYALTIAYRRYIGMPHAFFVACSSQLCALLAVAIAQPWLFCAWFM